jgi:flagellar motility protein MotE (MotC chaperone)
MGQPADGGSTGEQSVKKILNVLILTLALNFLLAAGGLVALLKMSHMDREKFTKVKELLLGPATQPVVEPASTQPVATTEPADPLAELLAKASGRPAGEQVLFIRQTFDGEMAELDRRHRELADLLHQIDLARQQTKLDRAKVAEAQKALADRQQLQDQLASKKGFQESLELYNAMPAKQVKAIFMSLSDDTVMQYLQAMEPRTAAKIIKEYKLPEETARIQKVLEKIRQSQPVDAPGTPVAPASPGGASPGGPQAAAPTQ